MLTRSLYAIVIVFCFLPSLSFRWRVLIEMRES